jgi:hypothetical protein
MVRDANLCSFQLPTIRVTEPTAVQATVTHSPILCNGEQSTLIVTAKGGTGAYQYSLSGGNYQSNSSINVVAGTYTIRVQDANQCTKTLTPIVVEQPAALSATASTTDILCYNQAALLIIQAKGGDGGYMYSLNHGVSYQDSPLFTVRGGLYPYTVRDANGCIYDRKTIQIPEPTPIVAQIVADTMICPGANTVLKVNATGGTGTLQYNLNKTGFQRLETFTVNAGVYAVEVRDQNQCIAQLPLYSVRQAKALTGNILPVQVNCHGGESKLYCYPSPFEDQLNVEFNLGQDAEVVLEIRDILSQSVLRFPQGRLAAGHFVSNWDTSNFASGQYVVALLVDGVLQQWQKVICIR